MIAALTGIVSDRSDNALFLRSGNFTFRVLCPASVLADAPTEKEILLHTHLHVREDDLTLFGFLEKGDLWLFEKLISVSGIGPKIALEILASGAVRVQEAISAEDVAMLSSIKGIGKKTAQRAILELREKMSSAPVSLATKESCRVEVDVLEALENLGWKRGDILARLKTLPESLSKTEEIIRWFLTNAS